MLVVHINMLLVHIHIYTATWVDIEVVAGGTGKLLAILCEI